MGHNLASWKTLDGMMMELRKKGVAIPPSIVEDLRAAKSMIKLSCMPGSGDAAMKAEEYMSNVEAYLVTQGQEAFGSQRVDEWLKRLEEASASTEVCGEPAEEGTFVIGVPRGQKWIRVEPTEKLSTLRITQLVKEQGLLFNLQKDGLLLIYGKPENLKAFLKQMTVETTKQ
jgi:hypothetical protein